MTIKLTTSYKISNKLHDAGFKGELCGFWFVEGGFTFDYQEEYDWAAYSFEAILSVLPKEIKFKQKEYCFLMQWSNSSDCYVMGYVCGNLRATELEVWKKDKEDESLADTAARLWLKLNEGGLV